MSVYYHFKMHPSKMSTEIRFQLASLKYLLINIYRFIDILFVFYSFSRLKETNRRKHQKPSFAHEFQSACKSKDKARRNIEIMKSYVPDRTNQIVKEKRNVRAT